MSCREAVPFAFSSPKGSSVSSSIRFKKKRGTQSVEGWGERDNVRAGREDRCVSRGEDETPAERHQEELLPPRPRAPSHLVDAAGVFPPAARRALESSLAATADELWAAVEKQRSAGVPALAERARALYSAWELEPHPPRATVLILLDVALGEVAIETGQGLEGPFTPLDVSKMRANTAPLLRASRWQDALTTLVRAVADAADATRARRRPDPAPSEPSRGPTPVEARRTESPPPARGLFTRLTAVVAGAIVILLALRQRRRNQARTPLAPPPERPKRLGPPRIDR